MNDIELVATDELLKELLNRFEHAVFCGLKAQINEEQDAVGQWHGNALTCVGLAQAIASSALKQCSFDDETYLEE
jgi:hypothetical protein